jgi:hypothetical protein
VTGTLTNPGDEAKRFIHDRVEVVNLEGWQTRETLKAAAKATRRDSHESRGVVLREIATLRLLI